MTSPKELLSLAERADAMCKLDPKAWDQALWEEYLKATPPFAIKSLILAMEMAEARADQAEREREEARDAIRSFGGNQAAAIMEIVALKRSQRTLSGKLDITAMERDEAEAALAMLVEALMKAHKSLQQAYGSPRLSRLDPPTRTQLQSASWAADDALKNLPTQTTAHLEHVRALEAAVTDEHALHHNILRGTIKLSRMTALRIAGATDYDFLKANQRTPGTVEVCQHCHAELDHPVIIANGCLYKPHLDCCPISQQKEAT